MNGELLRDGAQFQVVDYEFHRGTNTTTLVVVPGEGETGADVAPARVVPDEVTFALPAGVEGLEASFRWQVRDQSTGRVLTIVAWAMDMSNGIVRAAVRG